jgi:hypothetical protein
MKNFGRLASIFQVLLIIFSLVPGVRAQDLKQGVTDRSQVDADYHEQGEYSGSVLLDGWCRPIGLQVVAMGDGKFDALVYKGGLPGNGYDGGSRLKLTGSRVQDKVVLGGENLVVVLQSGHLALVQDPAGNRLGYLQPMNRVSSTMGALPPSNAIVLFDGHNTDQLKNAKITSDGFLEVGCETKDAFQNFTLHAEFRTPYMPYARGQGRGNSGFYLQKRYEVQVLDSFGLEPQNNDCGSLYKFKAPNVNMSFPPLRWQTYDITFNAPRFNSEGQKICKGRITVRQNGVLIHDGLELENKTGGGSVEGPELLPILFQNHNNPVQFRNIWIVDHDRPVPLSPAYPSLVASNCTTSATGCPQVPVRFQTRRRHLFRR